MHWQQQVYSSYSCILQILHSYTMANHLYGSMCTHIHIPLILLCFYCHELSFLSFHSDHLHEDEIISVLQLVQWMAYFIIFSFCIYDVIFACLLSLWFFVFVYLSFPSMEYVIFSISTFPFFVDISVKLYTWTIYRYMIYYCVIFFHEIFSVF